MRTIAIIGSGFSSISAAIDLASLGYKVTLYEKNSTPGGRARNFKAKGFTFDMGPTWYWMPDVFDEFFEKHGKKTSDYFELVKLDPGFSVCFNKQCKIAISENFEELKNTFESIEKGSANKLEKFMKNRLVILTKSIEHSKWSYDARKVVDLSFFGPKTQHFLEMT